MFLNARFYMYTNVYYHRTTRGIDLHLKEIFRDDHAARLPLRPPQGPPPLPPPDRVDAARGGRALARTRTTRSGRRSAGSGGRSSTAGSSGACRTRWCSTTFEPRRGQGFMKRGGGRAARAGTSCPPALRDFPFKIDMAQQDPRPLNPIGDGGPADLRLRRGDRPRVRGAARGALQVPARARSPSAGSSRATIATTARSPRRSGACCPRTAPSRDELTHGPPRDQGAHRGGPGGIDLPPGRLHPRPARRRRDVAAPGARGPHPRLPGDPPGRGRGPRARSVRRRGALSTAGGPVPAHRVPARPALPVHGRQAALAGPRLRLRHRPSRSGAVAASRPSISGPGRRAAPSRRWISMPTTSSGSSARTSRSTRPCCGGCSAC